MLRQKCGFFITTSILLALHQTFCTPGVLAQHESRLKNNSACPSFEIPDRRLLRPSARRNGGEGRRSARSSSSSGAASSPTSRGAKQRIKKDHYHISTPHQSHTRQKEFHPQFSVSSKKNSVTPTTTAPRNTPSNRRVEDVNVGPSKRSAYRRSPLSAIDVVLAEPDLQVLADEMMRAGYTDENSYYKRVAMTLFAPIDSSFDSLPISLDVLRDSAAAVPEGKNFSYDKDTFNYHIVAPRLVNPRMMKPGKPLSVPTRDREFQQITLLWTPTNNSTTTTADDDSTQRQQQQQPSPPRSSSASSSSSPTDSFSSSSSLSSSPPQRTKRATPNAADILVNGETRVVEIIQARRGWIYKIDSLLFRRWNKGPNVKEFIQQTPWLSKTRWIMERTNFLDTLHLAGPISLLLVPDDGWVIRGNRVPQCVFEALVRPENSESLEALLRWLTVPGLWAREDIAMVDWLSTVESPPLAVAHVVVANDDHDDDGDVEGTDDDDGMPNNNSKAYQSENRHILIEAMSVETWDIPVYNGWVHVLSQLPESSHVDLVLALWDCTHEFCYNCPIVTQSMLSFFDEGGLLPSPEEPRAYIVPPGSRPAWVCRGTKNWFPPGWDPAEWDAYLDAARKDKSVAKVLAELGHAKASNNLARLEDALETSRVRLQRVEAYNTDWSSDAVAKKKDPNHFFSKINRKAASDTLPPDCKRDQPARKISMTDLKYLTRWM